MRTSVCSNFHCHPTRSYYLLPATRHPLLEVILGDWMKAEFLRTFKKKSLFEVSFARRNSIVNVKPDIELVMHLSSILRAQFTLDLPKRF